MSRESFTNLGHWKELADNTKSADDFSFIVLGNKADMVDKREVTSEEGQRCARGFGCEFIETSAQTGEGVQKAFELITRSIFTIRQELRKGIGNNVEVHN
jgi:GTPase KRas protein